MKKSLKSEKTISRQRVYIGQEAAEAKKYDEYQKRFLEKLE